MSVHGAQLEAVKAHVEELVREHVAAAVAGLEQRLSDAEAELAKLRGGAAKATTAKAATARGRGAAADADVTEAADSSK